MQQFLTINEAATLIRNGDALSIAGAEVALDALPCGRWIGGTIPYFMTAEGGIVDNASRVFVTSLPELGAIAFAHYASDHLAEIVSAAPDNGFSLVIIPAMSEAHKRFAADAASYKDGLLKPTVGWIAGIHLEESGVRTPKVYVGLTGAKHADGAVVAHVTLPEDTLASIDIVNIFEPEVGDVLRFDGTSFDVRECSINGERANLATYLAERGLTHGLQPLVGDYAGANINVSFRTIDVAAGEVSLYAPVFSGIDYRLAMPIADHGAEFRRQMAGFDASAVVFSCNCILNFLHGDLEGQVVGELNGPATFGEIGYQLLNQTTVALRLM
jgi:hypothetical protein